MMPTILVDPTSSSITLCSDLLIQEADKEPVSTFVNINLVTYQIFIKKEDAFIETTLSPRSLKTIKAVLESNYANLSTLILRRLSNFFTHLEEKTVEKATDPIFTNTKELSVAIKEGRVPAWIKKLPDDIAFDFMHADKITSEDVFEIREIFDVMSVDRSLQVFDRMQKEQILNTEEPITIQNNLLDCCLKKYAPIDWTMRRVLREDPLIQNIIIDDVSPQCISSEDGSRGSLESFIDVFIKSKREGSSCRGSYEQRVLLIRGPARSGKTHFCKKYTWKKLLQYDSNKSENSLVVYVFLPELKDPYRYAIEEGLGTYEIWDFNQIEKLRKREVLWIFDGYDQFKFEEGMEGEIRKNFYATNQFQDWPLWKFIFTCKDGYSTDLFQPRDGVLKIVDLIT